MCPFCIATAAIITSSTAGGGGVAAAVTGVIPRKRLATKAPTPSDDKEVQYGNDNRDCGDAA